MIKLVDKEPPKGIWVGDMEDGVIGVIVLWNDIDYDYIGVIVQRYNNSLVIISMDDGWSNCFNNSTCDLPNKCRVRLLEKGETLIVT